MYQRALCLMTVMAFCATGWAQESPEEELPLESPTPPREPAPEDELALEPPPAAPGDVPDVRKEDVQKERESGTNEMAPPEPARGPIPGAVRVAPGSAGVEGTVRRSGTKVPEGWDTVREEEADLPPPPEPSELLEPEDDWLGFTFGRTFRMTIDGYVRASYTTITAGRFAGIPTEGGSDTRRNPYVGRQDGFGLGDARVNLSGRYRDLYFRLGFDGAFVSYEGNQDVLGALNAGLADAYLRYSFHRALQLNVGRFKPPFDVEELTPVQEQYFVHRSLESRGVQRQEGFSGDMPGFRPGRQLGVMLAGDNVLPWDDVVLGYALAITNGNNAAFNDNEFPAVYARLHGGMAFSLLDDGAKEPAGREWEGPNTYGIREGVFGGVSGFFNERTFGVPPTRQRDRVWGLGVDVAARVLWFVVQGQFLFADTTHVTFAGAPGEIAVGGHVQAAVELPWFGLAPGYRFAVYDPRVPQSGVLDPGPDDERVMHHTVGLRWAVPELPLLALINFTRSIEEAARAVPNDRLELAVQVTFE